MAVGESVVRLATSEEDGIPGPCKLQGTSLANGPTVQTEPDEEHSDDGLSDGEEVNISQPVRTADGRFVGFAWTADPTVEDTDADSLDDDTEVDGWGIETINRSGEAYRWNGSVDREANGSLEVTSDPLQRDTDDDGLTDSQERNATHTDPRDPVTYTISAEQAELIRNLERYGDDQYRSPRPESFGVPRPLARADVQAEPGGLTDSTSDFDFVTDDDSNSVLDFFVDAADANPRKARTIDRVTFVGLDGEVRTDTWLSNHEECFYSDASDLLGTEADLDPWDPDTDDDGLTDGQEMHGITSVRVTMGGTSVTDASLVDGGLNPLTPDSDGDGYWDGWIGVHGVGNSENVILYREHLRSGNGVDGDERVDEQVGIHEVDEDDPGTYLYDNNTKYHSNIHIGELNYGTDPQEDDGSNAEPFTEVTVEVDNFYQASDALVPTQSWERRIEQNYQLYGIQLDVRYDQRNVSKEDLGNTYCNYNLPVGCKYYTTPFGADDIVFLNANFKNSGEDYYMFVADRAADSSVSDVIFPGQTGLSSKAELGPLEWSDMTMVFTEPHRNYRSNIPARIRQHLSPEEEMRSLTAKTAIHEIGHQLNVGVADDRDLGSGVKDSMKSIVQRAKEEIYSGASNDRTPERVWHSRAGRSVKTWSVMTSGHPEWMYIQPTDDDYVAFSLEELFTLDLPHN